MYAFLVPRLSDEDKEPIVPCSGGKKPSQCHRSFPFSPEAKIKLLLRSVWCEELLWNEPACSLFSKHRHKAFQAYLNQIRDQSFPHWLDFYTFLPMWLNKNTAAVSSCLCDCTLPPGIVLMCYGRFQFPICICRHTAPSYACTCGQPLKLITWRNNTASHYFSFPSYNSTFCQTLHPCSLLCRLQIVVLVIFFH